MLDGRGTYNSLPGQVGERKIESRYEHIQEYICDITSHCLDFLVNMRVCESDGWNVTCPETNEHFSCSSSDVKIREEQYKKIIKYFKSNEHNRKCLDNVMSRLLIDDTYNHLYEFNKIVCFTKETLKKLFHEGERIKTTLIYNNPQKYYWNSCGAFMNNESCKYININIVVRGDISNFDESLTLTFENIDTKLEEIGVWLKKLRNNNLKKVANMISVSNIILENDAVATLTHEIFGHSIEKDWESEVEMNLATELSWLNVYDNPNLKDNECYKYDDAGNKAKCITLIENGDRKGSLNIHESFGIVTANARAQDYRCIPIVRMSNTYMGCGCYNDDELYRMNKDGIVIEKVYNTIAYVDGFLHLPIRSGYFANERNAIIKNVIVKVAIDELTDAKLGNKVIIKKFWCNKSGQEVLVGAGGPKIFFSKGELLNG